MKPELKLTQQHLRRFPEKLTRFTKVYIRSNQWGAYWRPEGRGYTTKIDEAGVYPIDDAWERVKTCGPEKRIVLIEVS